MRAGMPLQSILLTILFLPTTIFYFGLSSSLTLGVTAGAFCIMAVSFVLPCGVWRAVLWGIAAAIVATALVLIHLLFAATFQPVDLGRALASLAPMFFVIAAGVSLARVFELASDQAFSKALFVCFGLMAVSAVAGIAGLKVPAPGSDAYKNPVLLFTEPSHFALVFSPVLMYCCASSRGVTRLLLMCFGLLVAALLQSLTLVVGWLVIIVVCSRGLTLPLMTIVLVAAGSLVDMSYYANRVSFAGTQNISALVYIQGWQLLFKAFSASHGWGVGFQQFGLHDSNSEATEALVVLIGNAINLLDGGFTFAKLVGEFGVFGLAATALLLGMAVVSCRRLSLAIRGKLTLTAPETFACCMLATYPMELFVRGTGYFTPSALLTVASVWLLFRPGVRAQRAAHHADRSGVGVPYPGLPQ